MRFVIWSIVIPFLYVTALFICFFSSADAELSILRKVGGYFLFIFGISMAVGWGLVCANISDDLRMQVTMTGLGMIVSLVVIWGAIKLVYITSPFMTLYYAPAWNLLADTVVLAGLSFFFGYFCEILSRDKGEKSSSYVIPY